jgi:hypothetical protein
VRARSAHLHPGTAPGAPWRTQRTQRTWLFTLPPDDGIVVGEVRKDEAMELLAPDLTRQTCAAEFHQHDAAMRRELHLIDTRLGRQLDELRGELLKWGLLYWIGQAAATGAIVAGLLSFD